jgi:uncharacterized protein YecE (DUF72 family)
MGHYIGCSGWYYWHWRDLFYKGIKQSKWFEHYASKFGTVELNSTFYHFPRESTARGWYRKAPRDFVYTLKVNRAITHMKKFSGTKALVKNFYNVADLLSEKLGCLLFQLPPSMHYNEGKLTEILSQLDGKKKNVIEFRHPSWWRPEVYKELKKSNVIFCIVSAPGLPGDFVRSAGDIYVRFHGREWYRCDYSEEELKEYAKKIEKMRADNVFCYFNNDFNAYAVKNSMQLRLLLAR